MPFDKQPTLTGPTVSLRPLTPDDHDALFDVASDPLIWEQHPVKTRCTKDGFATFFQQSLDTGGALVISDNATQQVIGSSRFHGYNEDNSEVEIGWTFLARAYWGGPTNREVKRLMLGHAFQSVDRVVLLIAPENIRSQRAATKIGASRAGERIDGNGMESWVYEVTKPV